MQKNIYMRNDWRRLRKLFLSENPLCVLCRASPAAHVDHIRAHRGDESLFLDWDNLQALCHSCHSAKTNKRDGGFGREPSERPLAGVAADGWPTDRDHHWNK